MFLFLITEILLWRDFTWSFLFNFIIIFFPFWYLIIMYLIRKDRAFNLHPLNYWFAFIIILDSGIILNLFSLKYFSDPAVTPLFTVVTITLMMNFYIGFLSSLVFSFYFSFLFGFPLKTFITLFVIGIISAYLSKNLYSRVRMVIPFLGATISQIIIYLIYNNFDFEAIPQIFISNLIQMLFLLGVLPYLEYITRVYSDIGLLELGNLNHPLLRKLSLNASGTYYHSLIIANLVESASEAIKANPILLRVGAYFHDIGKSLRPLFFTENQKGFNPHDRINPKLSALILNLHVIKGKELARKYKLPILIEDLIVQHHGTRIKRYFFHKSIELKENLSTDLFKYPGPIPQFKEAAILMIADNIEAMTRSMQKINKKNIEEKIDNLIQDLYFEGQLDDCGLTLKEIKKIKNAMINTILNMNHSRISYPEIPKELLKEVSKNEN
ncbi:HDIG domain-containing metalloprotein [Marinitoga sp. 1155]|uniref:HDIG domain-containing metalloprotein n=2 Tax=unclassified Marinitoga TaxID=2640159 RepID=UPI0021017F0D|nr:HDIG domain-containing metalloprotein [Marinitoga sp. 1155]